MTTVKLPTYLTRSSYIIINLYRLVRLYFCLDTDPAEPEIQNYALQTGNNFNSCSIMDRIEIPTATPRFSGSPVPTDMSQTPADVVGHRKHDMTLL